jgi:hypothetical protein
MQDFQELADEPSLTFSPTSGEGTVLVAPAFGKPSGRLIHRADRSREVSDRARSSD